MSSPEVADAQLPSSPPFQSAQQQEFAGEEDLYFDSESDHLPDAPSEPRPSLLSSQSKPHLVDDLVAKQSSVEDDVDEDSEDSTTFSSRPTKFRGPPSTWRNWTASERDLAASLDQLQAKDLSIHLYNSFKLGQRNRNRYPGPRTSTASHSRKASEGSNWTPSKVWTAWPLPPEIVPREHDELRWEEDAVLSVPQRPSPRRPGQHLQEMLIAQVLRSAKERFHERERETPPKIETTSTAQRQHSHGLGESSSKTLSAKHDHDIPGQKPVVMTNDERASEILQATVQHMMTRLDNLLMGLHHARRAYLLCESSGSDSDGQSNQRSISRGRSRKRRRNASKSDEGREGSDGAPNHLGSDSDNISLKRQNSGSNRAIQNARSSSRKSRGQKFRDRKGRLGLRDWSDVIGVASMIGWHQEVIGRTSARCATLFEEDIKFRTLEEGKKIEKEYSYLPIFLPLTSGGHSQSETRRTRKDRSNNFNKTRVGGVHVDGFLQPIKGKKSWIYGNVKESKRRQSSRKSKEGI